MTSTQVARETIHADECKALRFGREYKENCDCGAVAFDEGYEQGMSDGKRIAARDFASDLRQRAERLRAYTHCQHTGTPLPKYQRDANADIAAAYEKIANDYTPTQD